MKILLLALLVVVPTLARAEPAIVFQTEKHDFGEVRQGEQLQFTFEFSNAGSDDLIIGQITAFS
jgi:hypothetical protein